jgi:hypothetical protein
MKETTQQTFFGHTRPVKPVEPTKLLDFSHFGKRTPTYSGYSATSNKKRRKEQVKAARQHLRGLKRIKVSRKKKVEPSVHFRGL